MEEQSGSRDWMPVFVVVPAIRTVSASVDEPQTSAVETGGDDYRQRVGTATVLANGDISVELFALPTKGRLLICKAAPGEKRAPWEGK